jgi:hypothetical protein
VIALYISLLDQATIHATFSQFLHFHKATIHSTFHNFSIFTMASNQLSNEKDLALFDANVYNEELDHSNNFVDDLLASLQTYHMEYDANNVRAGLS